MGILKDLFFGKREIPVEYQFFPVFEKEIKQRIQERKTDKYTRCTIDYNHVSQEESDNYISIVENYGYEKATKVRYDKGNTYIIIEYHPIVKRLHIVFHIKNAL